MKSFTDIEQSKKLAEFLPIASADLWYAERYAGQVLESGKYVVEDMPYYYLSLTRPSESNYSQDMIKDIPCWSLAALLDVLPTGKVLLHDKWNHGYKCICNNIDSYYFNNPVDACVEMILKLKEKNLL